ncbi:hypothetical protein PLESTM_001939000 [Pleodorina starrii]|nr:hypothetical protein PLESTM_001939000 [Pleodorina starrii]
MLSLLNITLTTQTSSDGALVAVAALLQQAVAAAVDATRRAALTTALVLSGLPSSGTDEWASMVECLAARGGAEGIRYGFEVARFPNEEPAPDGSGSGGRRRRQQLQRAPRSRSLLAAAAGDGGRLLDAVAAAARRVLKTNSGDGVVADQFGGYTVTSNNIIHAASWDDAASASVVPPRLVGHSGATVVAGLFLHQRRTTVEALREAYGGCELPRGSGGGGGPFAGALAAACLTGFSRTYGGPASVNGTADAGGGGGGIGTDVVFNRRSELYDRDVVSRPGDYYNISSSSGDLSPLGVPFGFFPSPLPLAGLGGGGYPVLLDTALTAGRLRRVLAALQGGGYLDAQLTESMAAQLVSYSADLRVLGYWRADFKWGPQGLVEARFNVEGLPAVTWRLSTHDETLRYIVPDLLLIFLAAWYCASTLYDIVASVQEERLRARALRRLAKMHARRGLSLPSPAAAAAAASTSAPSFTAFSGVSGLSGLLSARSPSRSVLNVRRYQVAPEPDGDGRTDPWVDDGRPTATLPTAPSGAAETDAAAREDDGDGGGRGKAFQRGGGKGEVEVALAMKLEAEADVGSEAEGEAEAQAEAEQEEIEAVEAEIEEEIEAMAAEGGGGLLGGSGCGSGGGSFGQYPGPYPGPGPISEGVEPSAPRRRDRPPATGRRAPLRGGWRPSAQAVCEAFEGSGFDDGRGSSSGPKTSGSHGRGTTWNGRSGGGGGGEQSMVSASQFSHSSLGSRIWAANNSAALPSRSSPSKSPLSFDGLDGAAGLWAAANAPSPPSLGAGLGAGAAAAGGVGGGVKGSLREDDPRSVALKMMAQAQEVVAVPGRNVRQGGRA